MRVSLHASNSLGLFGAIIKDDGTCIMQQNIALGFTSYFQNRSANFC